VLACSGVNRVALVEVRGQGERRHRRTFTELVDRVTWLKPEL
jgi:hypothetical protein